MCQCGSKCKNMSKLKKKTFYTYFISFFIFLRVIILLAPQASYVSAREFKHLETFGGNLLAITRIIWQYAALNVLARKFNFERNLRVVLNYENPDEHALSSVVGDYVLYGWSYDLLWMLDLCAKSFFNASIVTPLSLLIVPRMAICMLSFLMDFTLYRICALCGDKYQSRGLILASSYCMLVYSSRTLIHTKEMLLFAILMYFISESIIDSSAALRRNENIIKRLTNTYNKDTRKMMKRKLLTDSTYKNVLPIGVTSALGIFNRPAFAFYAAIPILFWLCRGCGSKIPNEGYRLYRLAKRLFVGFVTMLATSLFLVVVDSVFYGYTTLEELLSWNVFNCRLLVIPANQLAHMLTGYAVGIDDSSTCPLVKFIGHMLCLFHILGVCTYSGFISFIRRCMSKKIVASPTISMQYFMNMSSLMAISMIMLVLKPVMLDFLPLIFPFAYLSADRIQPPPVDDKPDEGLETSRLSKPAATTPSLVMKLWIGINILLLAFHGFVYEGGVTAATLHIFKEHQASPVDYHIVTSHMPPIPQMLFMQRHHAQEIFLREYGNMPMKGVIEQIITLRYEAYVAGNQYKLYLLMPAAWHNELFTTLNDFSRARFQLETSFFPHFAADVLHDMDTVIDTLKLLADKTLNYQLANVTNLIRSGLSTFHLNLYRIDT